MVPPTSASSKRSYVFISQRARGGLRGDRRAVAVRDARSDVARGDWSNTRGRADDTWRENGGVVRVYMGHVRRTGIRG